MLVNKNFTDVGIAEKMYSQRRVSELCNVFPSVFRHSLQYFGMFYALTMYMETVYILQN